MQSTRSFFNRSVFGKTIRRYWPMWAMYLLIMAFAFGICAQGCARNYGNARFYHDDLLEFTWQFGLFASGITACVSAMFVHSWMYNSRSAGAYSALPICRGSMFISITMAGIVPVLVCNLAAMAVAFLVALFNGHLIIVTALFCFLALSLEYIFFYGLATFCATLTGHVFVLPAVYVIFNFVVAVVEMLIMTLMETFTFGASMGTLKLDFLSPALYLFDNLNVSSLYDEIVPGGFVERSFATFDSWWPLIIYAITGIVLALIGLLIFRKRKMETSSDVVAVRILKPVFKYCLCFGCALVIGLLLFVLIFDSFFSTADPAASIVICICMLIGGFLGYFAAEMLMKKSFKVFKAWKGYLIAGAVIILFITALETDLFGYERHIPDIDKVKSVSVRLWGEPTGFTEESDIAEIRLFHERIVNNKSETEKNMHKYYSSYDYRGDNSTYPCTLYLAYILDNGNIVERRYQFIYNASDKFCSDLLTTLNQPHAIRGRIESSINMDYLEGSHIYYNYNVPSGTYLDKGEDYSEFISNRVISSDISTSTAETTPVPYDTTSFGDISVSKSSDHEYVHGNLQLTAQEARELYFGAIIKDINAGNIARIRPDDTGYKNRININIEFTARIPNGNNTENFYHQYVYIEDITEDAVHTIAALKELGLDFEALASSALEW